MSFSDVLPGYSLSNSAYRVVADSKNTGQLSVGSVCLRSDPEDIGFGEFGLAMAFTLGRSSPLHHFPIVFGFSSGMQMCGVDARRSITPMQNEGVFGCDGVKEVIEAVGGDVSQNGGTVIAGVKHPIASSISSSWPIPTALNRCGRRITREKPGEGFSQGESPRPWRGATTQGVTMVFPSPPVSTTPTSALGGAFASRDRASTLVHIDTSTVGHAPGLFAQTRERSLSSVRHAEEIPTFDS